MSEKHKHIDFFPVDVPDNFLRFNDDTANVDLCCVPPYCNEYLVNVKQRWRGKKILDIFKEEFSSKGRKFWENAIQNGLLLINEKKCNVDSVVKNGDLIRHIAYNIEFVGKAERVKVAFESEDLIIVFKPAGMPCHPQGNYKKLSLIEIVKRFHFKDENVYLHLINRLDRVTSGLVILTKNENSSRIYSNLLPNATKLYIAKVWGNYFPQIFKQTAKCEIFQKVDGNLESLEVASIDEKKCIYGSDESSKDDIIEEKGEEYLFPKSIFHKYLEVSEDRKWLICKAKLKVIKKGIDGVLMVEINEAEGKYAETWFKVLANDGNFTLILARLITGRTHQIRAHLKFCGNPIVWDKLYGSDSAEKNIQPCKFFEAKFSLKDIEIPHFILKNHSFSANREKSSCNNSLVLFNGPNKITINHNTQEVKIAYQMDNPMEICLYAFQYIMRFPADAKGFHLDGSNINENNVISRVKLNANKADIDVCTNDRSKVLINQENKWDKNFKYSLEMEAFQSFNTSFSSLLASYSTFSQPSGSYDSLYSTLSTSSSSSSLSKYLQSPASLTSATLYFSSLLKSYSTLSSCYSCFFPSIISSLSSTISPTHLKTSSLPGRLDCVFRSEIDEKKNEVSLTYFYLPDWAINMMDIEKFTLLHGTCFGIKS